jgi:hypothetical protein
MGAAGLMHRNYIVVMVMVMVMVMMMGVGGYHVLIHECVFVAHADLEELE